MIVKNEAPFIGAYLASWLPHLDEMVLFDGNSKDGTLETIKAFRESHPDGHKITLVENPRWALSQLSLVPSTATNRQMPFSLVMAGALLRNSETQTANQD